MSMTGATTVVGTLHISSQYEELEQPTTHNKKIEGGEIYIKQEVYNDNHFPSAVLILKYPYNLAYSYSSSPHNTIKNYSAKVINLDNGKIENFPDTVLEVYYRTESGGSLEREEEAGGSTLPLPQGNSYYTIGTSTNTYSGPTLIKISNHS